jgi:hypothetical protein
MSLALLQTGGAAAAGVSSPAPPLAPPLPDASVRLSTGGRNATLAMRWCSAATGARPTEYVVLMQCRPLRSPTSALCPPPPWQYWTAGGKHRPMVEVVASDAAAIETDVHAEAPETAPAVELYSLESTGLRGGWEYSVKVLARGEGGAG